MTEMQKKSHSVFTNQMQSVVLTLMNRVS